MNSALLILSFAALLFISGCNTEIDDDAMRADVTGPTIDATWESHFIKGLDYHGGGWWLETDFTEGRAKVRNFEWTVVSYPFADSLPPFPELDGMAIPALAIIDLANVDPDSIEQLDSESGLKFSGGDASLTYYVKLTRQDGKLIRVITNKFGDEYRDTFDETIFNSSVSRVIQASNEKNEMLTADGQLQLKLHDDSPSLVSDFFLIDSGNRHPIPALAVLPFDLIESVSYTRESPSMIHLEVIGWGLGTQLTSSIHLRGREYAYTITDSRTDKGLIDSERIYRRENDETIEF